MKNGKKAGFAERIRQGISNQTFYVHNPSSTHLPKLQHFQYLIQKFQKNLEKNLSATMFSGEVQLFFEPFEILPISWQLLNQVLAVIVVG